MQVVALAVVAPETPSVNVPACFQVTAASTLPDVGTATDWPDGASVTVAPPSARSTPGAGAS